LLLSNSSFHCQDNMVEFARHFTTIMRFSLVIFLSLIILCNIVVFILSVVQATNPNVSNSFPSSSLEHWGFNKENSSCDSFPYYPVRFKYQSQNAQNPRYEYCSWRSHQTWWRAVSMIFLIIGAGFLIGVLGKRSPANDSAAIWQSPKNVLRALLIPCGAMGINMFLLMCFDAAAVNQSQSWCDQYTASQASKDPVYCDYTQFVVTSIFDFFLTALWGLVTLFVFIRQMKRFRPYQQMEDENDSHEMLEHGNSGWRKKGGKSWIDKHLKKAKDRMKGRK